MSGDIDNAQKARNCTGILIGVGVLSGLVIIAVAIVVNATMHNDGE